jgi:hypothetical protein
MKPLALLLVAVFAPVALAQEIFVPNENTVHPPTPPPRADTEFIPERTPQFWFPVVTGQLLLPLRFAVPVYLGDGDRCGQVIGTIKVWRCYAKNAIQFRETAIRSAASAAKVHGADALLLDPVIPWRHDYAMSATAVCWRPPFLIL